ncbi:MAG: hypothetical protein HW387_200 [Parachlamydiales bacterium]|nr:hypothetical protein [Parachlamydiales bacterium]
MLSVSFLKPALLTPTKQEPTEEEKLNLFGLIAWLKYVEFLGKNASEEAQTIINELSSSTLIIPECECSALIKDLIVRVQIVAKQNLRFDPTISKNATFILRDLYREYQLGSPTPIHPNDSFSSPDSFHHHTPNPNLSRSSGGLSPDYNFDVPPPTPD